MKDKKLAGGKPTQSTQKYLDIAEIRDDLVVLNNGTVRGVMLVSSINFDLKSEDEQRAKSYQAYSCPPYEGDVRYRPIFSDDRYEAIIPAGCPVDLRAHAPDGQSRTRHAICRNDLSNHCAISAPGPTGGAGKHNLSGTHAGTDAAHPGNVGLEGR